MAVTSAKYLPTSVRNKSELFAKSAKAFSKSFCISSELVVESENVLNAVQTQLNTSEFEVASASTFCSSLLTCS